MVRLQSIRFSAPDFQALHGHVTSLISWAILLVLFLVGVALSLPQLMAAPFHEDEAIYAAWSLQITRGDLWLSQTFVDKPPITFYPIAASLALFGPHEWAARLPNVLWTTGLLALLWRIARHRGRAGWLAVLLALATPLLWALAGSAFTDPAMVALALLAVERVLAHRPGQAGAAFAAAFLAKPTALFFAPLILFWVVERTSRQEAVEKPLHSLLLGVAALLLPAWAWDASRDAPSWWALGLQAYGTLGQGPQGGPGSWVRAAATALGGLTLLSFLPLWQLVRERPSVARHPAVYLLLATLLLWIPLHALLGFQPWDRYLLPLVPVIVLLLVELVPCWLPRLSGAPLRALPIGLLALGMVLGAPQFARYAGLGAQDGRWVGIAEMGAVVESLPQDSVLIYLTTGRQLAWYAADTPASLVWGGEDEATLETLLGFLGRRRGYVLVREGDPLPGSLAGWQLVERWGQFLLLANPRGPEA
jgi:4-amino-4-deoxy-L-arabinose transferase-like glycosyltransferase